MNKALLRVQKAKQWTLLLPHGGHVQALTYNDFTYSF